MKYHFFSKNMKSSPPTLPWAPLTVIPWRRTDVLQGSVASSAIKVLWWEEAPAIRNRYIKVQEDSLNSVWNCEEHKRKIATLLRLMEVSTEETHGDRLKQAREVYFYRAVTIGRLYFWDDLWKDKSGEALLSSYFGYIAEVKNPVYMNEPEHIAGIYARIEQEIEKRRTLLLSEAKKTDIYLKWVKDYNDIIRKIEAIFWSVRLLIVSEESGEPITIHRMDARKIKSIRKSARKYEYTLKVDILGQSRKYRVIIDYGSSEDRNRPEEDHIKNIINPILVRHIEQKKKILLSMLVITEILLGKLRRLWEWPKPPMTIVDL